VNSLVKYDSIKNQSRDILQAGYNSLAVATQKAYLNDLNTLYNLTGKDIKDLNMSDVVQYIKALEKKGYRNSTINRKISSLAKILKLYQIAGLINKNPLLEITKIKKLTRQVNRQVATQINAEDVRAVISSSNSATSLIINFLANTGLRVSEMINIKNSDIEDYVINGKLYKRIRIVGKRKKERFIYITEKLYQDIKRVFRYKSEFLFHSKSGKPLHRVNVWKQIRQAFKTYTGKNVHPHTLRHFFATHKIAVEKQDIKAVSRYLGHSGTAITLDMYVDVALSAVDSMIYELTT